MRSRFVVQSVAVGAAVAIAAGSAWAQAASNAAEHVVDRATSASAIEAAKPTTAITAPTPETVHSGVRIVRLSQVRGVALMDRNTGRGFETAFANIPVVAGARLSTGQGVAEVEFEDNSSLRLAPETQVQFTELSRMPTGGTVTTIQVVKGEAYASLEKTKGNVFVLTEGPAKLMLLPGAHVRLDARQPQAEVAVFDGSAELTLNSAVTLLSKHQTIALNPAVGTMAAVVRGTEEQDFDAWDKQERDYHRQKASLTGTGGFGLYGANDLNYYGSFVDMPGCGSMWRPYFANAAWDPFGSGVWAYYPSAGYSWVSPYPWGWLPYHSGTWASCGAAGWGWRPGGSWYGVNNAMTMQIAKRPVSVPTAPGPVRNSPTLIPVNMKALPVSSATTGDRFVFRQNSAGLGVPRTEYGNLHGMAAHVEHHGMATSGLSAGAMAAPANTTHAGMEAYGGRMGGSPGGGRMDRMPGTSPSPAGGRMDRSPGNSPSMGSSRSGYSGGGGGGGMRGGSMSAPSSAPSGGGAAGGGNTGGHH